MRIIKNGCEHCGGSVYIDYKYGRLWRCINCNHTYSPIPLWIVEKMGFAIEGEKTEGKHEARN